MRRPVSSCSRAKRSDRAHHDWLSLAVPVGAAHLLVPGLKPHTQYQFSVLAQNKLGSGPFSEIVLSVPEGERPLTPKQEMRIGRGWQEKLDMGGLWGRMRRCWQLGVQRNLWGMIPACLRGAGRMVGHWWSWEAGEEGKRWKFYFCPAYLSHSGLPTTPAAPTLPVTEMLPPLSPPRGLVAVRTPRGVLLHWDPPEVVPQRLDGYILEGRQGSQSWEVLDGAVAGTEVQLLVPGLIKVSVGSRHGGFCGSPGPSSIPQTQIGLSSRFLPPPPIPLLYLLKWGWCGRSGRALTSLNSPPPGCSLRVSPCGLGQWPCQQSQQLGQRLHLW